MLHLTSNCEVDRVFSWDSETNVPWINGPHDWNCSFFDDYRLDSVFCKVQLRDLTDSRSLTTQLKMSVSVSGMTYSPITPFLACNRGFEGVGHIGRNAKGSSCTKSKISSKEERGRKNSTDERRG